MLHQLSKTGWRHRKSWSKRVISRLRFGFKFTACVCLSGCTLICLLNNHSLLKVAVIRLLQGVCMRR